MLVHFYCATQTGKVPKKREEDLANSLRVGLGNFSDKIRVSNTDDFVEADEEADVGAVFGLKGKSREILEAYRRAGKRTLLFDKGIVRVQGAPGKLLRVCIDADSPLPYMMRAPRKFDRWEALGVELRPRKEVHHRAPIVLALSSQKYCAFHGLGDATEYATSLVRQIREYCRKRPIIYRPKPSWHDFVPIEGTILSRPPEYMGHVLVNAHSVVTHGSSAAIDAIIAGVPAIVLGECAASPVAGNHLKTIPAPYFPSDEARFQWACALAYCQWSISELQSGEAWGFIRNELKALA